MKYSAEFEAAVSHAMLYEVGGHWKLSPAVEAGLIGTRAQRTAVGYVNDPVDPGGETKFGVAKNANPGLNIAALTWAQARQVYYHRYWLSGSCDLLPAPVAVLHFDGCVNHGVSRAVRFLQQAAGTVADGHLGPVTVRAVQTADPWQLCADICDLRETFYRNIVGRRPTQARFLNGWLRRIHEMRQYTSAHQV